MMETSDVILNIKCPQVRNKFLSLRNEVCDAQSDILDGRSVDTVGHGRRVARRERAVLRVEDGPQRGQGLTVPLAN